MEHDVDIEVAALNQPVEVLADGSAAGNGLTVDLDVIGRAIPRHSQRVDLTTLRIHLAGTVGVALMGESSAVTLGILLMAPEVLAGGVAIAGTAVQGDPTGAEAVGGVTGRNILVIRDDEGNPLIRLTVLALVGELVDTDLHGEAFLHVEGLLGADNIEGVHVLEAGGSGMEAFGIIVETTGGAIIIRIIVVLGATAGSPVAFSGGGSCQGHRRNHGKNQRRREPEQAVFSL